MLELKQNELKEVSGGCTCYCTFENGRYGITGWISEGFQTISIGNANSATDCASACRIQKPLTTQTSCR
jgi:hypothetical protein